MNTQKIEMALVLIREFIDETTLHREDLVKIVKARETISTFLDHAEKQEK